LLAAVVILRARHYHNWAILRQPGQLSALEQATPNAGLRRGCLLYQTTELLRQVRIVAVLIRLVKETRRTRCSAVQRGQNFNIIYFYVLEFVLHVRGRGLGLFFDAAGRVEFTRKFTDADKGELDSVRVGADALDDLVVLKPADVVVLDLDYEAALAYADAVGVGGGVDVVDAHRAVAFDGDSECALVGVLLEHERVGNGQL